ncbi:MAG: hypothetical protein ABH821_04890 [archaeon]
MFGEALTDPKKAVKLAFEKPSIISAFVLVLVTVFLSYVLFLVWGLNVTLDFLIVELVKGIIALVVLSIVIFVVAWLAVGKKASGSLNGILTVVGLTRIPIMILTIISFLIITVFMPFLPEAMLGAQAGQSVEELNLLYSGNAEQAMTVIGIILLVIFTVALLIVILSLYYRLIKQVFKYNNLGTIIMLLFVLFVNVLVLSVPGMFLS